MTKWIIMLDNIFEDSVNSEVSGIMTWYILSSPAYRMWLATWWWSSLWTHFLTSSFAIYTYAILQWLPIIMCSYWYIIANYPLAKAHAVIGWYSYRLSFTIVLKISIITNYKTMLCCKLNSNLTSYIATDNDKFACVYFLVQLNWTNHLLFVVI